MWACGGTLDGCQSVWCSLAVPSQDGNVDDEAEMDKTIVLFLFLEACHVRLYLLICACHVRLYLLLSAVEL